MFGSKAMHLRILARVWEASPEVEVLQHVEHVEILLNLIMSFFVVGHSGGTQSWRSRGTRGSWENSGYRGRTGRGPSSRSSTGIHAPTRGEHVPPRSPTRRTSRPHNLACDVPHATDIDEKQELKRAVDLEGMEEGCTACDKRMNKSNKKMKNEGKCDKQSDGIKNHYKTLLLE